MVAISVIGILLCLLFPALASVKNKGKSAQARADIAAILNACRLFEADYGVLPNVFSSAPTSVQAVDSSVFAKANANTPAAYMTLMSALSGFNYFTSTPCDTINTRKAKYLQVPYCYSSNSSKSPCGFVDPWGNTYGVALDVAGEGQTSALYPSGLKDSKGNSVSSSEAVLSRVSIYSLGPGVQWKSNGTTLDVSNSDVAIKSWK